jgi:nitroimidazol reductase NimA-like FMN-containing flavoprotein (pyridoxamine 5'-phosphate oxidase superfamily)
MTTDGVEEAEEAEKAGAKMKEATDEQGCATGDSLVEDGLEEIPTDACMRLLREGAVGLLALAGSDAPDLRPVNFALHRHNIVMRTGRGRIFEGACQEEAASFVISESDRLEHSGWSVVVTGRLSICDPSDAAIRSRVRPWARADKREWVLLSTDCVTGRRLSRRADS